VQAMAALLMLMWRWSNWSATRKNSNGATTSGGITRVM
jgi:hypothetical protein